MATFTTAKNDSGGYTATTTVLLLAPDGGGHGVDVDLGVPAVSASTPDDAERKAADIFRAFAAARCSGLGL